jgi:hypothetical protein
MGSRKSLLTGGRVSFIFHFTSSFKDNEMVDLLDSNQIKEKDIQETEIIKNLGRVKVKDVVGVGVVKFYNNKVDKQFGFLASDKGDIFIHGSHAIEFICGDEDHPVTIGAELGPNGSMLNPPRRGDQVVFIAEKGPRGLRAIKWVKYSKEEYQAIIDEINNKPVYRLVHRRGPAQLFGGHNLKVLWVGKNLSNLRQKYHAPLYDNNEGALFFEKLLTDTDQWDSCDDPR